MTISNRGELEETIVSYTHRNDLQTIAGSQTPMDQFITLAEDNMNRELKSLQNEVIGTLTTAAGVNPTQLPADFQDFRELSFITAGIRKQIVPVGRYNLSVYYADQVNGNTQQGRPQACSVVGRFIEIAPDPGDFTFDTFIYFASASALVGPSDTNLILDKYPNVYVYGVLAQAYMWMQDAAMFEATIKMFTAELQRVNVVSATARSSGRIRASQ